MANFQEYIETNRKGKVKAEISERWQTRVIPKGLHEMGQNGAVEYLNQYGKGISTPKIVQFALKAEAEGCHEMALGFWMKAFEMETGSQPDVSEYQVVAGGTQPKASSVSAKPAPKIEYSFPAHLQPGNFVTMQPVDAPEPREFYIASADHLCQPKRDGSRTVVFVDRGNVFYQSRTMSKRSSPSLMLDEAFLAGAKSMGVNSYILDGELTYLDWCGAEHRTSAQAAQVNTENGKPDLLPELRYCIFEAISHGDVDLTNETKLKRIEVGGSIFQHIQRSAGNNLLVECLPTAITPAEKEALCKKQQTEEREGEVWTLLNTKYIGGKTKGKELPTVRTKYLSNWELIVTGLTPPLVQGRPFGAIEVSQKNADGTITKMGSVGTGFTIDEMKTIAEKYSEKKNEALLIKVISQGLTENNQLWHARFDGFVDGE